MYLMCVDNVSKQHENVEQDRIGRERSFVNDKVVRKMYRMMVVDVRAVVMNVELHRRFYRLDK